VPHAIGRISLLSAVSMLFMATTSCTIANRIDTCDVSDDGDTQVNQTSSGDQYPTPNRGLVRLASGLYVATWASEDGTDLTAPSEVRAALFQQDGQLVPPCGALSGDIAISTANDEVVGRPTVAVGPTAASPVYFVWRATDAGADPNTTLGRIQVRLMRQDLCPWNSGDASTLILQPSEDAENAASPSIAVRSDGLEAVVAWYSVGVLGGDADRIRSRPLGVAVDNVGRLEANGCNGELTPCTHSDRTRGGSPSITAFQDGYALVWPEPRNDGTTGYVASLAILDANAAVVATGVSTRPFGDVFALELATAANAREVLLAQAGFPLPMTPAPEDDDVFIERFDATASSLGPAVRVNGQMEGRQVRPAIAALPGGAAIVAWQSATPDGDTDVYGRVLDADDEPMFTGFACDETDFRLSATAGTYRITPSIATDGDEAMFLFGDSTPGTHATDRLGLSVQARAVDLRAQIPLLP
jgi:hypothetical protein